MSTTDAEVDELQTKRSFREAFVDTLHMLRAAPDTEEEWDARESQLHAMIRESVPSAIGVTLARTLLEQPIFFVVGVGGLVLWTALEAVPFIYRLLF
ncbi:hypothetical protein [Paraburkholderia aromaticivorans]|uniref:Uncharacterized protein n=1 Tax=Paraburkholderia aromaticivorans TaxID=2026199 RepID=A0A248VXS0_9BURK|nr:hypothetical protein [Paraburkholderia aromaticivorans]ASW03814.1 hypothetical protein CJU94_37160 [Paraburkholderia aromaticivorans]